MIGKVMLTVDKRPHCYNGWAGTKESPACNYTGGHFCDLLADHQGDCKCTCGATTNIKPPDERGLGDV
jgi:hypothetical protein